MRTYVKTRAELSIEKDSYRDLGFLTYRTRTHCGCTEKNRQRDAVIVADRQSTMIINTVVRCKVCERGGEPCL